MGCDHVSLMEVDQNHVQWGRFKVSAVDSRDYDTQQRAA